MKKFNLRIIEIFLYQMLPLGKTPNGGQAMVIYHFGHGHFTKNGKIPFFYLIRCQAFDIKLKYNFRHVLKSS